MTTIQLGPITFDEGPIDHGWFFNGLKDWYGLTDDKSPVEEQPQHHGAFEIEASWRSAAVITVEVGFLGNTHAELLEAIEDLSAVGATGPEQMTVTDALRATSRRVSVRASPIPDTRGRSRLAGIAIDLVARDPRRYAAAVASAPTGLPTSGTGVAFPFEFPADFGDAGDPGTTTMTNTGKAATAPLLAITGGLATVDVKAVGSGRRLVYNRPIPVGSTLYLDHRTRRGYIDAPENDVTGFMDLREWWEIAPGATSTVQLNGTGAVGTPTLTGFTQSAWW